MVNRIEEIKEIVNSIVRKEGIRKTTSIEPSRHGQDDKNTQLNTLARILTWPKDTCIALCLWKGELLIASNQKNPESVERDLKKWQEFIRSRSQEKRLELLKNALEKSYEIMEASKLEVILKEASLTEEDKENLMTNFGKLSDNQRRTVRKEKIACLVEKLFELSKKLKEEKNNPSLANKIWEFILPIEDSNRIMKLIFEGRLDKILLSAISNNPIISIKSEKNIHAEMKIIDHILEISEEQAERGYFYIGIGKLCCLPCQKVIDVINGIDQYRIGVPGTHGKTYPNWELLKTFRNNHDNEYEIFEKELKRIKDEQFAQQVRESTCLFPERLTSFNFEELFIAQQGQP